MDQNENMEGAVECLGYAFVGHTRSVYKLNGSGSTHLSSDRHKSSDLAVRGKTFGPVQFTKHCVKMWRGNDPSKAAPKSIALHKFRGIQHQNNTSSVMLAHILPDGRIR